MCHSMVINICSGRHVHGAIWLHAKIQGAVQWRLCRGTYAQWAVMVQLNYAGQISMQCHADA